MNLQSLDYNEFSSQDEFNPWELQGLTLGKHNLIVGKNATGKTRIIGVIDRLAKLIQVPQTKLYGSWSASFVDQFDHRYEYLVETEQGEILREKLTLNGLEKLNRTRAGAKIYSEKASTWHSISPPNDRLVLHVRRDKDEFPFFESLVSWATGVRGFSFANTSPNLIEIPGNPVQLTSLNAVPSALEQLSPFQIENVLRQLRDIGYEIETASTRFTEGLLPTAKIIYLKEKGIPNALKQFETSQGLFRAFSLLTIIEFLKSQSNVGCILIDDLGEGLDFDRCRRMAEIIFKNIPDSKIQFITTSNDISLMNAVPLSDFIVCERSNHIVQCFTKMNSKKKFDDWQQLGLNNFDLLTSNFLLDR